MEDICLGLGIKVRIYRTQMTQSNADVVYYQQVCVTPRRLHPVFPLIAPVLQEAPCAPRYKEGVAGDTQPVRPGERWGGGVPSWRKSVSEAPIAASVTSVSRIRRERRASRRRSSAGSVCRFGNRGMLREDAPEERREATEDEFKVFHFS